MKMFQLKNALFGACLFAGSLWTNISAQSATIYSESFTSSLGTAVAANGSFGNWIFTNSCTRSALGGHTSTGSALFSGIGCQFGNNSNTVGGDLTTPSMFIPATGSTSLTFNYSLQNECGTGGFACSYDILSIQVSNNGGTSFSTVMNSNGGGLVNGTAWVAATYNLSAYAGQTILVRFNFNSLDGISNAFDGVYVDDIAVSTAASALNFDGVDDNVDIGNAMNTILDPLNKITVEAWVKPSTTAGLGVIIGNYGTPAGQMQFLLRRDGDQYAMWVDDGAGFKVVNSGVATVTTGIYQHVAGVWDGSKLQVFINGVLKATTTGVIGTSFASTTNLVKMGLNNINENFTGNIDEVRIWTIARTQCEINTFKNCEIPTNAAGLLANYHFNQGYSAGNNPTVTTLTDASGNSNNGTLTAFALTTGTISNWVSPGGVINGSVTPLPSPLGSSATPPAVCMGGTTTLNGTGANTYTWTSGVSNGVAFTPTATATYTLSGTVLATTCTYTSQLGVTVNPLPVISVNSGSICAGKSFTMVPSGANTYTFSNGSAITTPTANASYSVTGTSAAGCVSSAPAVSNVTVNALPVVSVNSGVICNGQSFTMSPSGATTYTFSNGSAVATPTANASYSVTGTGTNGCVSSPAAVSSVTVNATPVISVNSGAICAGKSFTMVPSGASTYTFSNGSSVATPTANASYSVTGTSTAGCVSSVAAVSNVTVNALPVVAVNSGVICNGQSFTMTPSGASTYTFSNGSSVATPTANASYSVTGTSTAGCVSSAPAVSNVTVNAAPVIAVNSGVICNGQSFTMTPSGASTYTFSNGSAIATPTANASYSVTGTSTAGCVSSSPAVSNVTVNAVPVISVNSGVICGGQSFTMSPSGATTYTFSNGSAIVTPTANASYSVTGTSTNGCVSSVAAVSNVTVNAVPVISVNSGAVCNGQSFTMSPSGATTYTFSNGSAIATPTANASYSVTGTGTNGCVSSVPAVSNVTVNANPVIGAASGAICTNGTFTITPNGANTYTISGGSSVVSPTTTTSYSVTGTSTAGCTGNTAVVTVSVQSSLTVSIAGSNTVCDGNAVSLTANGASTYTWNNGAVSNSIAPTPTVNTTYSVTGSSGTCSNSAVISVTVNSTPTVSAVSNTSLICSGQTVSLTASGAVTYTWSTNATGANVSDSPTITTTYTVTGVGSNGCSDTASVTLAVSPCTNIHGYSSVSSVDVYPNPTTGKVTVAISSEAQVVIMNMIGEVLSTEKVSSGLNQIDLSAYANGIYFVNIIQNNSSKAIKLIKE